MYLTAESSLYPNLSLKQWDKRGTIPSLSHDLGQTLRVKKHLASQILAAEQLVRCPWGTGKAGWLEPPDGWFSEPDRTVFLEQVSVLCRSLATWAGAWGQNQRLEIWLYTLLRLAGPFRSREPTLFISLQITWNPWLLPDFKLTPPPHDAPMLDLEFQMNMSHSACLCTNCSPALDCVEVQLWPFPSVQGMATSAEVTSSGLMAAENLACVFLNSVWSDCKQQTGTLDTSRRKIFLPAPFYTSSRWKDHSFPCEFETT